MAVEIIGPIIGILFGLFMFALMIFALVVWILMLVDVAKRKFKKDDDKTLWLIVIILAGFIGAVVYYFAIKHPDKH